MSKSIAVLAPYERLTYDYSSMVAPAAEVRQAAGCIRDRQRVAIVDIGSTEMRSAVVRIFV